MKTTNRLKVLLVGFAVTIAGCGSDSASYSVLPDGDTFYQNTSAMNSRIDMLWVIDNSGSMESSQANLANNFPSFIDGFASRGLDFQIGVIGTDAFVALPQMSNYYNAYGYLKARAQPDWAKFRDGGSSHSGIYIMNKLTPNLESVFVTNATLGVNGIGDERPLQSMRVALESPLNSGFLRANSYLAVILLTDEDDFSHDGNTYLENQYSNPALHPISSYVSTLDTLTGSNAIRRNYAVHSIAIQDAACRNSLGSGRKIGVRVNEMADATGGVRASLCGNFATELELIADNIIELATQFYLSRVPRPESIVVKINDVLTPNIADNPGPLTGGWYYNSAANSIVFQGDYVPAQGARIQVYFDPIGLGQ